MPAFSGYLRRRIRIRPKTWKWLAAWVLAAVLVLWVARSQWSGRSFDWTLAATGVSRLHWSWLVLSLVPICGTYYGRALRWAVFLGPLKTHPSIRNLLSATVIGFTAITLFGRAGDFVRPYLIAVKEEVPVSSQMAAWLLERIFDLLMASLIFGFALTHVRSTGIPIGPRLGWVLAFGGRIVGCACAAVLLLLLSLRHFAAPAHRALLSLVRRLPQRWVPGVEKVIAALFQGVESARSDGALLLIFTYSLLEWALIAACYWCVARSFAGIVTLTVVDVLILMGFVSFGGVVQIPGVGGGTQVTVILVLTELFAVRLELATAFAMVLWIFNYVVIVPVGLFVAVKEGLDWHGLRRMGRGASA